MGLGRKIHEEEGPGVREQWAERSREPFLALYLSPPPPKSLRHQHSGSQGFLLLIKISKEAVNHQLGKFKVITFPQSSFSLFLIPR